MPRHRFFVSFSLPILAALLLPALAFGDDPLASKVLVVYATNSADSVAVKDHYIQARFSQPATANVCAITLPDPTAATLSQSDWLNAVKTPIRNCLTAAGKTQILYIVLAYIRPFGIALSTGLGYYALDSYISDIWDQYATVDFNPVPTAVHRYYADAQNQGNVYSPFQSLATFRAQPRSQLIYSTWRLDGATPAIAIGLVDKATQTMNHALGAACIDRNRGDIGNVLDASYGLGDWDLHKAAVFLAQAGISVVEDSNVDEFGAGLAGPRCPADGSPVAFYSGWYSLNNYNGVGVFNWAPGAIGFHLDSLSMRDPRGGTNWSANALIDGITVTSGAMAEPYLQGLPRPAGIYRNLLEGANVGDAFMRNTRWLKWMIINVGDPLYRPFPATGLTPFNPPAAENSLAIAARDVVGGLATTGTITLSAPAPAGGVAVALSTLWPAPASLPPSVTVPAGAASANFTITTNPVTAATSLEIVASAGAATLNNSMTVYPLLASVALSQSTVSAGQTITGTVFLNNSAPAGGVTVSLSSTDTTVATVPSSVLIPAGLGRANFTIDTSVAAGTSATQIQAALNGSVASAGLTAVHAINGVDFSAATASPGAFVVFEVYLSTPAPAGGVTLALTNSNPAVASLYSQSISVPPGSRYGNVGITAGPGTGTTTIQVSYGGDTASLVLTVTN